MVRAVTLMRLSGNNARGYVVAPALKYLPDDIAATISAFSNGGGGTVILGLSEKDGFTPVEGFDSKSMMDALSNVCTEKLVPPVRPDIRILLFEGKPLVVANIAEMMPADKPCYIKVAGRYSGSYIRTGMETAGFRNMRSTVLSKSRDSLSMTSLSSRKHQWTIWTLRFLRGSSKESGGCTRESLRA